MSDVEAVLAELQAGYGDATQTVLDRQVALAILKRLREAGWASPDDVATLALAAGGEIRVTDRVAEDAYRDGVELIRWYDPETFSTIVRGRVRAVTP